MTDSVFPAPPQYPAGPFVANDTDDGRRRGAWIDEIDCAATRLREVVSDLADARRAAIQPSLQLLEGLHARWVYLIRAVPPEEFARSFYHPENQEVVPLWRAFAYCAWHARHHTAHIEWVKKHALTAR